MRKRRDFLRLASLLTAGSAAWPGSLLSQEKKKPEPGTILVNDVHSELNSARVWRIATPQTVEQLRAALREARDEERAVCIAGSRHAMGGQQFCADAVLIDIRKLNRILSFDRSLGLVEVESGVQWPLLLEYLQESQRGEPQPWAFAQKPSGADDITVGGSLSANIHGTGLAMAPFVQDVESFRLVDAKGSVRNCSRTENAALFRLAIGGYGLLGAVYSVTLRLVPRRKVERLVEVRAVEGLAEAFAERIYQGHLYGQFHCAIDERSPDFLRKGVLVSHRPVDDATPMRGVQRELSERDRRELLLLAHTDKSAAFERQADHLVATHGYLFWSDEQQMTPYPEGYHRRIERQTGAANRGSEALTEIFCERPLLARFLAEVRDYVRRSGVSLISAGVRLIETDRETFLPWARKPYACVSFNVHIDRTTGGMIRGGDALRRLVDIGLRHGGGFHPTYNRYALRRQVDASLPQMPAFLQSKRRYDPDELFQSDWYRHHKNMYFPER